MDERDYEYMNREQKDLDPPRNYPNEIMCLLWVLSTIVWLVCIFNLLFPETFIALGFMWLFVLGIEITKKK